MGSSSVQMGSNSVQMGLNSVQSGRLKTESELSFTKFPLAEQMRTKSKISKQAAKSAILEVCREGFVTLKDLAEKVGRKPETLRIHYLNEMVKSGDLVYKFPESPNHPGQAYKAAN